MHAGSTERIDLNNGVIAVTPTDGAVGITGKGRIFKLQAADPADERGAPGNSRGRATLARRHTLDHLFRIARRWRRPRSVQNAQGRAGSVGESSGNERSRTASTLDPAIWAGAVFSMPLPLRFLPMMSDATVAPLVVRGAQAGNLRAHMPLPGHEAAAPLQARSWPWQVLSSVAYRLRCWTAPGERRKALRLAQSRERVTGAAYVFLNALQSGEPPLRHFRSLQRHVRRLDSRVGVPSGISEESVRVLREAADRTAAARETVRDKILSFHREELLYDFQDNESFHHADGVLLVMECRMVTGIALYGHALRCIAAADVAKGDACKAICHVMETVDAREAKLPKGVEPPRQVWLGSAVARLPYRTLVRLHAVLSHGFDCGGGSQEFLDELALVVGNKTGVPIRQERRVSGGSE